VLCVQLFKLPPPPADALPTDTKATGKPQSAGVAAAAKAPAAKQTGAAAQQANSANMAAPEAEPAPPPEPCSLLSPELAARLNPVVLYAHKASGLPDAPATKQQLEGLCERLKLSVHWPPAVRDQLAMHTQAAGDIRLSLQQLRPRHWRHHGAPALTWKP